MPLAAGTLLGPYEILAPLGSGGMGEVYRARDARLGRDVAIKVLPAALASEGERLRRFEKEARSASALNHPNIVTVYDVGTSDGVSWIAMERVEGQTLRGVLASGAIPLKKLLGTACQIAEGLAKAHATGIVHRDLKPENLMVTKEGTVKILDFGLAKLTGPATESGELTQSPTVSAATEAGVVLGTVAYMSPEQTLGEELDFRSDQFSFGSILYEMATGKRAFARGSAPETMAAVIREEPVPLASAAPETPVPLRWIVERCHAKDPEERYASTKDLARDLARLREGLSEGSLSGVANAVPAARRGARRVVTVAFAAAVLAGGAVLGVLSTRKPVAGPPVWRPLTFRRGSIGGARFAPDGKTVIYTAAWQGRPAQLFTTRLDSTESTALPLPSANLASVSGNGVLVIVLPRDPKPVIAEVSLAGGAPRELVEGGGFSLPFAPAVADWSPLGDGLAVTREGRLEFPVGKVLVPGSPTDGVQGVRFSPDGKHIAFIKGGGNRFAIGVTDLNGRTQILSDGWETTTSLAWHPKTGEVWFSARDRNTRFGVIELQAVSLSGKRRVVARTPTLLIVEDIAPDGSVLLRSDDWPTTMMCLPPGASREVDLSWLDFSWGVDLSDDGKDVLFLEGGAAEGAKGAVYMRRTDGSSPAVRLADGPDAESFSPDKKWFARVSAGRIVLLPTGPGESRTIQDDGLEYRAVAWFRDGKRLLVEAKTGGTPSRLYVRDLAAGPPRPFTADGFRLEALSPDGTLVVAQDPERNRVLLRVAGGEPSALPGLVPRDNVLGFDASGKYLFVAHPGVPLRIDRYGLASGKLAFFREISLPDPTGADGNFDVQITPDGACYCYTFMRSLSRLYYVEGLR